MAIGTATLLGIAASTLASVVGPKLFGKEEKASAPPPPAPLAATPQRDDDAMARARREQEMAEKRRRGRSASIIAGDNRGELGNISRPEARGAQNLGNVGQQQ